MALLQNVIMRGTHASRPTAGSQGLLFFETDTGQLFRDSGSAWQLDDTTLLYTAKGQLLASSASAVVGALAAGTDGYVLTADSAQTLGVKWAAAGATNVTTKGDLQGYSTVAARVPVGTDGYVLTADSTQALGLKWAAAAAGGAVTQLSDQTVSGSAAASITISSISGAYSHLLLLLSLRTTSGNNNDDCLARMNSDSGANYYWQRASTTNNGVSSGNANADTSAHVARASGGGATANDFSGATIWLHNYASTTPYKAFNTLSHLLYSGSFTYVDTLGGVWQSTTAMTQIVLTPGAGSWAIGSRVTLYGYN